MISLPLWMDDQQKFYRYCLTGLHDAVPAVARVKISRRAAAKERIAHGTKVLKRYGFN